LLYKEKSIYDIEEKEVLRNNKWRWWLGLAVQLRDDCWVGRERKGRKEMQLESRSAGRLVFYKSTPKN
jgi:hypothetical protein